LAFTIVRVASGGLPVVESERGLPYYEADNGYGIPVTFGDSGIPLGSVSGTLLSSVVDFWSAGDTSNITTAGGAISNWIGRRSNRFAQSSGTLQPTSDTTNRLASFDGTDDLLGQGAIAQISATVLPNGGSGSRNDEGFPGLGMTFDDENNLWVVNIGVVGSGIPDVPDAPPGQLIKLSPSFLTTGGAPQILQIIELSTISPTIAGAQSAPVQGLTCILPDGHLAFGSKNDNSIYVITKTGALVRQLSLGSGVNPNAVFYDHSRDEIGFGRDSSDASPLAVTWINKTTGAVTQTKTVVNNPDGIVMRQGEPDVLYITYGNNAENGGRLDRFDVVTSTNLSTETLSGSCAIEHPAFWGNILLTTDDAGFHQVAPSLKNRILKYRLPEVYPLGSRICLFGVERNKTVSATSKVFLSVGAPTSTGRGGVSFGKSSGVLRAQISKGTAGTQAVTNWTYAGYNTTFLWFLDYNLAAGTVELFVNGVSLGAQAISGPPAALNLYQPAVLGANWSNGTPTSYADCEAYAYGIAVNATQREILEATAAWSVGLQALLPASNPWKTRAPNVQFLPEGA
jgi:hypothetical protein